MNYLVKNGSDVLKLTVVSGTPTLPEGMELLGLESVVNPNALDLSVSKLELVEIEASYQVLVQAEVVAVEEVLAVPGSPEKWTKEGEEDVLVDPEDVTWTHVEAIPEVLYVAPVAYQAAIYNTVPAVMGLRMVADSAKAEAKAASDLAKLYSEALTNAIKFGDALVVEFASENMALGITQANKTSSVRKAMSEVLNCLVTGSLYDAMVEVRLIPTESKDAIFLSDARLLAFVNKIETYLKKPLSVTL